MFFSLGAVALRGFVDPLGATRLSRMNIEDRDKIISRLEKAGRSVHSSKGSEYSLREEDVLTNFKEAGDKIKTTCPDCGSTHSIGARAAWAVYFIKQVYAVLSHVASPNKKMSEPLESRVVDVREFATLLQCIDEDE